MDMVVKRSIRLAILLLSLHSAAVMVTCVTSMSLAARLLLLMAILASMAFYLARDVFLLMPVSWREIKLEQDTIVIFTRDGSKLSGLIEGETVVSSFLIILRIRLEDRLLPVFRAIFPDALGADEFREFCVRLRFA